MRYRTSAVVPVAFVLGALATISPAVEAQVTEYVYDSRNKLVEVRQGESILARFQWDSQGRLVRKIGAQGLRDYVYDGRRVLAEHDESGDQVAKYNWAGDRVVSVERVGEGVRYFHYDALGSVVTLTDASGGVAARYLWDAWGQLRNREALADSQNRLGYTGHRLDEEVGLHHAQARHLDPSTGRFTTQDAYLGDPEDPASQNRYAYAHGNPVKYVDPNGNFVFLVPILVGVIAAEIDIIHQEFTQGKELFTLDPSKGVNAAKAAKTGVIAAAATATGQVLAGGALAGTGALGIGGQAIGTTGVTSGSALIAGTAGGAGAAWTGGTLTGLSEGQSLDRAVDRGNVAALSGALGGAAGALVGTGTQALASKIGSSQSTAQGLAAFAGGFTGDQAAQQTLMAMGLQDQSNFAQSLASGVAAYVVTDGPGGTGVLVPATRPHGVNLLDPKQIQARPPGVTFGPPRGGGGSAADRGYAYQVSGGAEKATYVQGTEFEAVHGGVLIDAKRASSSGSFYDVSTSDTFTQRVKIPEIVAQAQRQLTAAQAQGMQGVRWEVADANVAQQLQRLFNLRNLPITVVHTPAR